VSGETSRFKYVVLGLSILVIAVAAVLICYMQFEGTRYSLIPSSDGFVYEIDRRTGRTWLILRTARHEVDGGDIPETPIDGRATRWQRNSLGWKTEPD